MICLRNRTFYNKRNRGWKLAFKQQPKTNIGKATYILLKNVKKHFPKLRSVCVVR